MHPGNARVALSVFLLGACASPFHGGAPDGGGGHGHDLSAPLSFDGPAPSDLAAGADLAGAPDLSTTAPADLARVSVPDLATTPPDLTATGGTLEGPCDATTACPGATCGGLPWGGCCMPGSNLCELVDFDGTCQTVATMSFEWGPPSCM